MRVLTVGQPRAGWWMDAVENYQRRLQKPWRWEWESVEEGGRGASSGVAAASREGERLLARVKPHDVLVALDVQGHLLDSPAFAHKLQAWLDEGRPPVFVIGGAFGLSRDVLQRADWTWSLSPLTLPHDLALVVVAEQLYRAYTIASGHPYHK